MILKNSTQNLVQSFRSNSHIQRKKFQNVFSLWILNRLAKKYNIVVEESTDQCLILKHRVFSLIVKNSFLPSLLRSFISVSPDIIIGEGFMKKEWWILDGKLEEVLNVLYKVMEDRTPLSFVIKRLRRYRFLKKQKNNPEISEQNISHHYDLGNDFFASMLDDKMIYSSGIFHSDDETLESAQENKINCIKELMCLEPGLKVLDIGCGWGAMSYELMKQGCNVTGISLSKQQIEWCCQLEKKLIKKNHRSPEFLHIDYRNFCQQTSARFDRVVVLEVLDHIGKRHHKEFFNKIYKALSKSGTLTMQVITRPRKGATTKWIDKYIYPGGYISSYDEIKEAYSSAGFKECNRIVYSGRHYATTLENWRKRFIDNWPNLNKAYLFDEEYYRMWLFFFAASISVFNNAGFGNMQLTLKKSY